MIVIKCCKDCTEREVGCHGWCEKYIQQKASHDKRMSDIRTQKQADQYARESTVRSLTFDAKSKQAHRIWQIGGRK